MELKEFIKGVLSDVTNAIKESQEEINNGALIAPSNQRAIERVTTEQGDLKISYIEFEVAITADSSHEKSSDMGGGITVLSAFIGSKTEKEEKIRSENVSRIKFSIPLVFPLNILKKKDNGSWRT